MVSQKILSADSHVIEPADVWTARIDKRFLDLSTFNGQPLVRDLSGLEVEYRIVQIYCRDAGRKEAALSFGLWRESDKDKPTAVIATMNHQATLNAASRSRGVLAAPTKATKAATPTAKPV